MNKIEKLAMSSKTCDCSSFCLSFCPLRHKLEQSQTMNEHKLDDLFKCLDLHNSRAFE
jgi:hypothetical protein